LAKVFSPKKTLSPKNTASRSASACVLSSLDLAHGHARVRYRCASILRTRVGRTYSICTCTWVILKKG
jgi:hypothetical protein